MALGSQAVDVSAGASGAGTDASSPMPFRLSLPGVAADSPPLPPQTLREYEDAAGLMLGTELASYHMLGQDRTLTPAFLAIPPAYFNLIVSPNFDWYNGPSDAHNVRPTRSTYDFYLPDAAVDYCLQHGLRLQGGHLAWGSKTVRPPWLAQGNFSKPELMTILEEHIRTLVKRYKGRVQEYTVVNEWLPNPLVEDNAFWYDRLGKDFIEPAFRWARAEDPQAYLEFSDFAMENIPGIHGYYPDRADQDFQLVGELKGKGVPIDGVAFHMHLFLTDFVDAARRETNIAALVKSIKRFQSLGVDVNVNEFDLRTDGMTGTEAEQFEMQGRVAGAIYKASLSAGVRSFTIWGINDRYGTILKNARPWAADDAPKPFIREVSKVVKEEYQRRTGRPVAP